MTTRCSSAALTVSSARSIGRHTSDWHARSDVASAAKLRVVQSCHRLRRTCRTDRSSSKSRSSMSPVNQHLLDARHGTKPKAVCVGAVGLVFLDYTSPASAHCWPARRRAPLLPYQLPRPLCSRLPLLHLLVYFAAQLLLRLRSLVCCSAQISSGYTDRPPRE